MVAFVMLLAFANAAFVMGGGFQMNIQRKAVQHDVYSHPLSSNFGAQYMGYVSVGTPPQPFKVIIDTGSEQTWLPAKGCVLNEAADRPVNCPNKGYDMSASSSAVTENLPFHITYGSGSTEGELVKDEFMLGNAKGFRTKTLKLKNKFRFGAAKTIFWRDDGILALSPPEAEGAGGSLIEQLVADGQLDEPIFTVYLANCLQAQCPQGGVITFGALDTENCGAVVGYAPVDEFVLKWRFRVEKAEISGRHPISRKMQQVNYPLPQFPGPMYAFTDTGSQVLQIPVDEFYQLFRTFNLEPFQPNGDVYLIECDRQIELKLTINGMQLTIPRQQLIDQNRFTTVNRNGRPQKMCGLNIEATQWNAWTLGDPFIRSYCQIHDYAGKRVGFAPVKKA